MLIQEMPEAERPRERLWERGAGSLREAELVAILLRTGVKGASAVAVGEELLKRFGGLDGIAGADAREIAKVRGVGQAKAVQLKAAFEIGVRLGRALAVRRKMDEPGRVAELLGDEMRVLTQESARVVLVDTRLQLLAVEEITRGLLDQALIHPREVFAPAIARRAHGVVLVHNHPSGDPSPSEQDLRVTRTLADAARVLEMVLVDHVIIGRRSAAFPDGWFSFKAAGHL